MNSGQNIKNQSRKKKKHILYVLHGDFSEDASNNRGGTQLHVKNLVEQLRKTYDIYVLARDEEYIRLTDYSKEKKVYKFFVGEIKDKPILFDETIGQVMANVLSAFSIDLVHIHHTVDLSFDVFREVKKQNIPMLCTIHDYYYICPTIKLLDSNLHFCSSPEECSDCDSCLTEKFQLSSGFYQEWQKTAKEMLGYCSQLFFPSFSAKEIMENYYPQFSGKMQVIYHGLSEIVNSDKIKNSVKLDQAIVTDKVEWNLDETFGMGWALLRGKSSLLVKTYIEVTDKVGNSYVFLPEKHLRLDVKADRCGNSNYNMCGFLINGFSGMFAEGELTFRAYLEYDGRFYTDGKVRVRNNVAQKQEDVLKVGFLGGMVPAKGSRLIGDIIKSNTNKQQVMWYIIGTIGDKTLDALKQDNLVKVGTYSQEMVQGLLEGYGIDLVCLLPLWAETFSYTLSEAAISGIPVLATDIGAISERIKAEDIGFLVDVKEKPEEIMREILSIWNEKREDYLRKKKNITNMKLKSLKEMAEEYRVCYDTYTFENNAVCDKEMERWLMAAARDAREIKIKNPEEVVEKLEDKVADLTKQLVEANDTLQKIYASPAYKVAKRLPFFGVKK